MPRSKLPEMIRRIEKISDQYGLPIVNFGHAGDGNIHVNIMADKEDGKQMADAELAIEALFRATLALGGTMSGEHGVGIMKAPYLSLELSSQSIHYMKTLKKAWTRTISLIRVKSFRMMTPPFPERSNERSGTIQSVEPGLCQVRCLPGHMPGFQG